jgi:hypothetical protein
MLDKQAAKELWKRQAEPDPEEEAKAARIAEAVRIGVLIPEIRALPDGGRSLFDKETWDKLQDFRLLRLSSAGPRR